MTTETDGLTVSNGYPVTCVADHEKIRVMVKTGARLTGQVFSTPGGLKR